MLKRVCLVSVLALSLTACSSMPSKYAFWREESNTQKPNLADVPAAPNTADAKAEMDAMRTRLEQDRDKAYLAAQGVIPVEDTDPANATVPANPTHMEPALGGDNEMAPAGIPGISQQDTPPPAVEYQYPLNSGTVQYNYAPTPDQAYVYGNSPVQIARQGGVQSEAIQAIQTANESISIDLSALDAGMDAAPTAPISSPGVSGVPLVFFKHGSAALDAKDRGAIKQLAADLKQQSKSVVIAGHSSTRTGINNVLASRDVNLRMSAKRANAVMKELAKYGVSPEQIFIAAYGDTFPNTTQENGLDQEAADRRVEILFDR